MINGKVRIHNKKNIEGEHTFDMKIDNIKKDEEGNIIELYLKLTETKSKFQIKITFIKRGVDFLSKFFVEEFLERVERKEEK